MTNKLFTRLRTTQWLLGASHPFMAVCFMAVAIASVSSTVHAQDDEKDVAESMLSENWGDASFGSDGAMTAEEDDYVDDGEVIPEGIGLIGGQVFDSETADVMAGVTVTLEWRGSAARDFENEVPREETTTTNEQGVFGFKDVPSGRYKLLFFKTGYKISTMKNVKVYPGQTTRADFPLPPKPVGFADDIFDLEDFSVDAADFGSTKDFLDDLKQQSPGAIDFLTSEDFAKFGGSDLASVIQRLPGVTVVEGQFAVVRGLGDRYNSTLLNGLPVPSPDPVRQGLQLDLFPTSIIESVVTQKTALPANLSNSSGAAFDLSTKGYPEETTTFFKGGIRFNTNSMNTFLKSPSTGFDDNMASGAGSRPSPPPSNGTVAQILAATSNKVVPVETTAPLGLTFSAGTGTTIDLDGRDLGLVFSSSYNSEYQTAMGSQQDQFATPSRYFLGPPGFGTGPLYPLPAFNNPGSLFLGELGGSALRYDLTESEADVLIGVLAGVGLELDRDGDNRLDFTFLYSQSGSSFVQSLENGYLPAGFSTGQAVTDQFTDRGLGNPYSGGPLARNIVGRVTGNSTVLVDTDTISYEERNLQVYQMQGEHLIDELNDLQANWGVTYGSTTSNTPNETVTNYLLDTDPTSPTAGYTFGSAASLGEAIPFMTETWRNIEEDQYGARTDFNYDWESDADWLSGALDFGAFWANATRNTDQTDVQIFSSNTPGFGSKQELVNYVLAGNGSTASILDSFSNNDRNTIAGYTMVTFNITDYFRVSGGGRFGNLQINSSGNASFSPTISYAEVLIQPVSGNPNITNGELLGYDTSSVAVINEQLESGGKINRDFALPSAAITFDITEEVAIRAGYAQTIAQPSFRELSPYFSRELGTGDTVVGNPLLKLSDVENFDVRVEYRFRPGSIVAIGGFYKTIQNPIEQIVIRENGTDTSIVSYFNNPNTAQLKGIEFEFQTDLDFIADELEYWSFGTNFTYIDAKVGYPDQVLQTYLSQTGVSNTGIPIYQGPYTGSDGPPYGNNNLPTSRRLFDQPEYIVNANITYNNPEWGTAATLSVFSQSDVLTSVGSGSDLSIDQYSDSYYQLDFTMSQEIVEGLVMSFRVTNLTDTTRSIIYDSSLTPGAPARQEVKVGQSFRIAFEYTF